MYHFAFSQDIDIYRPSSDNHHQTHVFFNEYKPHPFVSNYHVSPSFKLDKQVGYHIFF